MGQRERSFVGPSTIHVLRALILIAGVIGLVAGVAYTVNGMTQASAWVTVPVTLKPGVGASVDAADPDQVPVRVGGLPDAAEVFADSNDLSLSAWGSTVPEQLLARSDSLLLGLGVAAAAFLLAPVLRSVADGRPFDAGNAARTAGLAAVILVVGWLGPVLTGLGSLLVIGRLGLEAQLTWSMTFGLVPLLLTALLFVLAEAFRRGEQISRDVDGLV